MKVDVKFVNFPVSDAIRSIVAERIGHQIEKYGESLVSARAVFSVEGFVHHCRLSVAGGEWQTTVVAGDSDISRSVDLAIDKLGGSLRKIHQRRKIKRPHDASFSLVKHGWPGAEPLENAFDRYEAEFVREFDDSFEKAV